MVGTRTLKTPKIGTSTFVDAASPYAKSFGISIAIVPFSLRNRYEPRQKWDTDAL